MRSQHVKRLAFWSDTIGEVVSDLTDEKSFPGDNLGSKETQWLPSTHWSQKPFHHSHLQRETR